MTSNRIVIAYAFALGLLVCLTLTSAVVSRPTALTFLDTTALVSPSDLLHPQPVAPPDQLQPPICCLARCKIGAEAGPPHSRLKLTKPCRRPECRLSLSASTTWSLSSTYKPLSTTIGRNTLGTVLSCTPHIGGVSRCDEREALMDPPASMWYLHPVHRSCTM